MKKDKHLFKLTKHGYEKAVSPFGEEIGDMYLINEDQAYVAHYSCDCGQEQTFYYADENDFKSYGGNMKEFVL